MTKRTRKSIDYHKSNTNFNGLCLNINGLIKYPNSTKIKHIQKISKKEQSVLIQFQIIGANNYIIPVHYPQFGCLSKHVLTH